MAKHTGLGKGLDSLIPTGKTPTGTAKNSEKKVETGKETMIKISLITPNRLQPRKTFDEASLSELSESIKLHGIISPLVVVKKGSGYEIVAGERRYRAAQMAGLTEVPAIVKDYSEREQKEIAIIENIQREDINPIEEALAYNQLIDEYGLKQDELAKRLSKSRTAITNLLRLLKLSENVQQYVIDGQLSEGHARALLSVENAAKQEKLAKYVIDKKLSVRETEALVKKDAAPKKGTKTKKDPDAAIYKRLEDDLKAVMGTKVSIKKETQDKGKIVIEYYSLDELDRLVDIFNKGGK